VRKKAGEKRGTENAIEGKKKSVRKMGEGKCPPWGKRPCALGKAERL